MENAWVVSGDEVRASSVVPCNLIQARQYANTDGHRPDANLILAGFQLQKCQGISRLKRIVILSSVVISVMQRHVNYARIHNNTAYIPPRCNSRYGRARNTPKSCNDRVPIPPKSFPFSLPLSLSPSLLFYRNDHFEAFQGFSIRARFFLFVCLIQPLFFLFFTMNTREFYYIKLSHEI